MGRGRRRREPVGGEPTIEGRPPAGQEEKGGGRRVAEDGENWINSDGLKSSFPLITYKHQ